METKQDSFAHWCIVDLFGHTRLAGYVTEATIGGCAFVRLDVPECDGRKAFTRYFGQGAIYSLSPVAEEIARGLAAEITRGAPVQAYELPKRAALPAPETAGLPYADPDYDDGPDEDSDSDYDRGYD